MARTKPAPRKTALNGQTVASQSLVASGRKIDLSETGNLNLAGLKRQSWQTEAWNYYEQIGEIWYAWNLLGNQASKAILQVALKEGDNGKPVPLLLEPAEGESIDPRAKEANQALTDLVPEGGSHADLILDYSINHEVAGESYLINLNPGGLKQDGTPDSYEIYSIEQVIISGDGKLKLRSSPLESTYVELPVDAYVARLWRRSKRWRLLAESSMRAVLGVCEELVTLGMQLRAQGNSRLNAGLLLVPNDITFDDNRGDDEDQTGGNASRTSALADDMVTYMGAPLSDPSSAASLVPNILMADGASLKEIRLVDLSRKTDTVAIEQRKELLQRLGNGLDLPADALSSTQVLNHWSAWLLDEQTYKNHVEPLLISFCSAMTSAYLRPALIAGGMDPEQAEELIIWFDPTAITSRPDATANAIAAYTAGALGTGPFLRTLGFDPDEDQPTPDELAARIAWIQATASATSTSTDGQPVSPTNVVRDKPSVPRPIAIDARSHIALTASSGPSVGLLGPKLAAIDHARALQLTAASDAFVVRTLEMAGTKLRRQQQGKPAMLALIDRVPNWQVPATLAHELDTAVGAFTATDMAPLQPRWDQWVTLAQKKVRQAARQYGADFDDGEIEAQQTEDRDAGWLILAAGLASIASQSLTTTVGGSSEPGEWSANTTVPPGIINGAMSRAGGAVGEISPQGTMLLTGDIHMAGEGAAAGLTPAPGLATGITALDLFKAAGIVRTSWIWATGDPDKPFIPHDLLDQTTFEHFDDPALSSSGYDFPEGDFFYPGDHLGCLCSFDPNFDDGDASAPETEA